MSDELPREYPGEDTTSYSFNVPTNEWHDWLDSLPRSVAAYERIRTLLQNDVNAVRPSTDEPLRKILVPIEQCQEWADTVPRSASLSQELQRLIDQDIRATETAVAENENIAEIAPMFASRINIRCMQAVDALRDEPDVEAALEQLKEIQDIAAALES